jgi:hypothetical protein
MDKDFEAWVLCHEIGLKFQYKADAFDAECPRCKQKIVKRGPRWWLNFHSEAAECGAGHKSEADASSCLCSKCATNLILDITQRKQKCFKQGCNRLLVVNTDAVFNKILEVTTRNKSVPLQITRLEHKLTIPVQIRRSRAAI